VGSVEAGDRVAEGHEGAADLAVAAFLHGDLVVFGRHILLIKGGSPPLGWYRRFARHQPAPTRSLFARAGAAHRFADSCDQESAQAVFEGYAVVGNHLLVKWLKRFIKRHFVHLGFCIAGVRELVCQVTVIRQQEQPRRIFVEPTHWVEAMIDGWQKVVNCLASLAIPRAHVPHWFIEDDSSMNGSGSQYSAVKFYLGRLIYLCAFHRSRTVDRDSAGIDCYVGTPTTERSARGEVFV
jgi:hypothetical protein